MSDRLAARLIGNSDTTAGGGLDLIRLADKVKVAAHKATTPPPPGESRPITFTTDHLGEDGWGLVWEAVHAVREHSPKVFVQFTELNLAILIVEELEQRPHRDVTSLTTAISERAAEHGPRVVSTPLSNVQMDSSAIRLADDAVLVRALADRHANDADEDVAADFDIERWLGTRMSRTLRTIEIGNGFDTTRTAALLTVEHGAPALALARARARAQYAIAMWIVLAPPEGRMMLPDLGVWGPQPFVHLGQRHRPLPNPPVKVGGPSEEGRFVDSYGPFALPDVDTLQLPFDAMSRLEHRGPLAVLTSSLQLLTAARASRLQPSERVRALMAAVECLGESPSGKNGRKRFMRLARRHETHVVLSRRWDEKRVESAVQRMVNARNIATHGADGALLDLGYPVDARRRLRYGEALGVELAAGSLQADLPILVHVVGQTLAATIRELAADSWSDEAFERYFAG